MFWTVCHGLPRRQSFAAEASSAMPLTRSGVLPGSTSPDTAHDVSKEIFSPTAKNGVESAVVEWREAALQKLGGQAPHAPR